MPDALAPDHPGVLDGDWSADLEDAHPLPPWSESWVLPADFGLAAAAALPDARPVALTAPADWGPAADLAIHDRIHVIPRFKDFGAVLTDQDLEVEVWNAFLTRAKRLTAIEIDGPVGIEVDDPYGLPTHYPASESRLYTVRALAQGDPTIANLVTWVFTGIDSLGTNLRLVGFRIIPVPFLANATFPIVERLGFQTGVLRSNNANEQRRRLRSLPSGSVEKVITVLDRRESAELSAILERNQPRPFGVAFEQYSTPLTLAAAADQTTIRCDTTDLPFVAGRLVFLWKSSGQWEVQKMADVQPDRIITDLPLNLSWTAGDTLAMPMEPGQLPDGQPIEWLDRDALQARVRFEILSFGRTAGAAPASWEGYDLLPIEPDRQGPLEFTLNRTFTRIGSGTGPRSTDENSPAPDVGRPFIWTALTRPQLAALRNWLMRRRGQAVPFWLPSFQSGLVLAADMLEDATIATLAWSRYAQLMFEPTAARRHLAFFEPHLALTFHKVLDADDPQNGLTESITVTPAAPRTYPAASTVISFLTLCRLEADEVEIHHLDKGVARAEIRVREIPHEAPE